MKPLQYKKGNRDTITVLKSLVVIAQRLKPGVLDSIPPGGN